MNSVDSFNMIQHRFEILFTVLKYKKCIVQIVIWTQCFAKNIKGK